MAKARNRNLAGLAGLAAMGAMMAKGFKKGPEEDEALVEDRGTMVRPAAPAALPAAAAALPAAAVDRGEDYGFEGRREGSVASLPGRQPTAMRQTPAAARPAPPSYSAEEAAYDLARESTRGVKPVAPVAAPAASAAAPASSTSRGLTLGTPTRPAPGAPSIYAGPEAWAEYRRRQAAGMKKGGAVKKMASGGSVSSASKRGDGIAQRGKTRGRMI